MHEKLVEFSLPSGGISGVLSLRQDDSDSLILAGALNGPIKPGSHGLHVHENSDISDGCNKTGPHFDLTKVSRTT